MKKTIMSSGAKTASLTKGLFASLIAVLIITTAAITTAKEKAATNRAHVSTTALTTGLTGSTANYVAVPTANGYDATSLVNAASTKAAINGAAIKDDAAGKTLVKKDATVNVASYAYTNNNQAAAAKDGTAALLNKDALLNKTASTSNLTAAATTNLKSAKAITTRQNGQASIQTPNAKTACSCSLFPSTNNASTMTWLSLMVAIGLGFNVLRIVMLMKKTKVQSVATSRANFDHVKNMAMFAMFKAAYTKVHEKTMLMKARFLSHFQSAKTLLLQGIYNFMTQISWHFKANFGFPYGNRTLANFVASE